MYKEVKEKLDKDPRFKKYLRENSNWYTELNRDPSSYDKFVKELMKANENDSKGKHAK